MRRFSFSLFGTFILVLLFSGCAPVYVSNTTNAPLFGEKGTLMVSALGGTNGYDLQFAHAPTKHFVVIANGSYQSKTADSNSIKDYHNHYFGEVGGGYYTKLGERGRFEIIGGYGIGQSESGYDYNFFEPYSKLVKGYYERYFIQADIGNTSGNNVMTSGVSIKGSYVNFYKFASETIVSKEAQSNFYFEPAVFFRVGWKYVKFQFEFAGSILASENPAFNNQPFLISAGLVFNIPMNLVK